MSFMKKAAFNLKWLQFQKRYKGLMIAWMIVMVNNNPNTNEIRIFKF